MTFAIATSQIVQQAFRFMEKRPVASFGDDSEEATYAAEQYDVALAMCLEVADWSFASTVAGLPPRADPVLAALDPAYPGLYELPADHLVLRDVWDGTLAWRVDGLVLRTTAASTERLAIRYTRRITNETELPATFQTAVALQLAVLLAPIYVEVSSKQDRLAASLEQALERCGRTDARAGSSPSGWAGPLSGDWAAGAVR